MNNPNEIGTCCGWTLRQWAQAAEHHFRIHGSLPPEGDTTAALQVTDTWYECWETEPSEPVILGTDIFGNATPPVKLGIPYIRWAHRLMAQARLELAAPTVSKWITK